MVGGVHMVAPFLSHSCSSSVSTLDIFLTIIIRENQRSSSYEWVKHMYSLYNNISIQIQSSTVAVGLAAK